MTTAIKRRRGTTAEHSTFVGLEGELTVDVTKDTVVVHDGSTTGGFPLLREDLSNNANVLTTTNTKTLSNKTLDLASNTVTGTLAQFNAALSDSNFVDTTSTQTIGGVKTFSSTISGSIDGNAATVTNGVYTTGAQTIADVKTFSSNPVLSAGTANGVLYLNGSKVATSGSALTFDGTNLGIGNTSPSSYNGAADNLVIGSSGSNGMTIVSGTANAGYIMFADGTTGQQAYEGQITYDHSVNQMWFNVNAAEQMRLTSTGLGIGTSSPQYKLHVAQSSSAVVFGQDSTTANIIGTNAAGTASQGLFLKGFPLTFTGNGGGGAEHMRLDSSGNLGLGVTPSAWISSGKAIDIAGFGSVAQTSSGSLASTFNAYQNSAGNWIYKTTNAAAQYQCGLAGLGQHAWFIAPSGTAGATATLTQAMTLDASGNLLLGTTSSGGRLTVDSGSTGLMGTFNSTHANGGYFIYQASGTTYGDIGTAAQAVGGSASDFGINARGSRNLVLGTNNTERARIDSSGRMGLGTTSPDSNYYLTVGITSSDTYAAARFNRGTTSSTTSIAFANPNGVVGTVSTSGTSTAYNTSSDYRLKHDIAPMTGALAKVAALKPVTYKWNTDNSNGEGFIAHELAEVVPQAVTGEKDAVDADGNPVYQGIDTSFLVATLTAAIQELNAKVQALEAQLNKGA